jgi:hypothetical protein
MLATQAFFTKRGDLAQDLQPICHGCTHGCATRVWQRRMRGATVCKPNQTGQGGQGSPRICGCSRDIAAGTGSSLLSDTIILVTRLNHMSTTLSHMASAQSMLHRQNVGAPSEPTSRKPVIRPGQLHQANSTRPTPPGQLHQANSTWPTPPGQLHQANSTRPTPPGQLHQARSLGVWHKRGEMSTAGVL